MATKALTLGAQRPVFEHSSVKKLPGKEISWRALLLKQDAQAIWDKIASTVRAARLWEETHPDQLTQDLFIRLLVTDRFGFYLENRFTDAEIEQDLLSLISG